MRKHIWQLRYLFWEISFCRNFSLFHLIPRGGITWLPIYFFTSVGAYKYGWNIGAADIHLSAEKIQKIDTALNNMEMRSPWPYCCSSAVKKIPELMKGIGKGVHSFKEGMNGIGKESEKKE